MRQYVEVELLFYKERAKHSKNKTKTNTMQIIQRIETLQTFYNVNEIVN